MKTYNVSFTDNSEITFPNVIFYKITRGTFYVFYYQMFITIRWFRYYQKESKTKRV